MGKITKKKRSQYFFFFLIASKNDLECFRAGTLAGLGLLMDKYCKYDTKTSSRWWQDPVLKMDSLNHLKQLAKKS